MPEGWTRGCMSRSVETNCQEGSAGDLRTRTATLGDRHAKAAGRTLDGLILRQIVATRRFVASVIGGAPTETDNRKVFHIQYFRIPTND
jgi:hypothetical protein